MEYTLVKETKEKKAEGETDVYINSYVRDRLGGRLTDSAGQIKTLYEGLETASKMYGNINFLGRIIESEEIVYLTYGETRECAEEMARFICTHSTVESPLVGICSENRPEWIITEHATYFYSGANCPIYPSFGWSAVKHILKETSMEMLFLSQKSLAKIVEGMERDTSLDRSELPKTFVVFDEKVPEAHLKALKACGVKVHFFWRILKKCRNVAETPSGPEKGEDAFVKISEKVEESAQTVKFCPPTPDTIATICYTSGTTGAPKGAMLSHRNFMSVAGSFLALSGDRVFFPLSVENRYLSFLPLAHVFERVVESTLMISRCSVIYYRGNPKQLQKDFSVAKPHYFVGVPRVFNSVKMAIEAKAKEKGVVANTIFRWAVFLCIFFKNVYFRELFGKTVFRTIRQTFGGSILCMLSGSAPLSMETATFFEAVFNCPFFEGYGQTETTAGNITTEVFTTEKGVIGIPFTCNKVKLLSKPEYNALAENNQGELMMQGPAMFMGYYKQEELTRQVFHTGAGSKPSKDPYNTKGDKWVKTGDIAEITKKGNLKIIGRCKEIFKLSQGEYIIPEKIENQFLSRKIHHLDDLTIIGYPSKDYLLGICTVKEIDDEKRRQIQECIQKEGLKLVDAGEMIKIEIPRKIIFTDVLASIDNQLLTPSGKKIRKHILAHFQKDIDAVYS